MLPTPCQVLWDLEKGAVCSSSNVFSVVLFVVLQVLWNVESGEAICGSPTGADFTLALKFYQHDSTKLVSTG